ncbi:MAG TPA: hypothetical protein VJJ02_00125 [Candidatus Paceibacterota bacterium]
MGEFPERNGPANDIRKTNADEYLADDIALSKITPRLVSQEPGEVPEKVAEQLIHEVDEFLADEELYSKGELPFLLAKLDAAIAINNDPKAKEMREELIRKFGADARES